VPAPTGARVGEFASPGTIEDQQSVFEEDGFGHHARAPHRDRRVRRLSPGDGETRRPSRAWHQPAKVAKSKKWSATFNSPGTGVRRLLNRAQVRPFEEERLRLAAFLHDYQTLPPPWQRARRVQTVVATAVVTLLVSAGIGWALWANRDTRPMRQIASAELFDNDLDTNLVTKRVLYLVTSG